MKKLLALTIVTLLSFLLAACGPKLEGTYHGPFDLTFKSNGTVSVGNFAGGDTTYIKDGDKITFRLPGGANDIVLTLNEDGSLEGFPGKFTK